jgi:hypothetical protein
MKPSLAHSFRDTFFRAMGIAWVAGGLLGVLLADTISRMFHVEHPLLAFVLIVWALSWVCLAQRDHAKALAAYGRRPVEQVTRIDVESLERVRANAAQLAHELKQRKSYAFDLIGRFLKTPSSSSADVQKLNAGVMACASMADIEAWERSVGDLLRCAISRDASIPKPPAQPAPAANARNIESFYNTRAWRHLKSDALHRWGSSPCACCGTDLLGKEKHVDHILPRSKYPHLALKLSNLQVMCRECNLHKGNRHAVDFRTAEQKRRFGAA